MLLQTISWVLILLNFCSKNTIYHFESHFGLFETPFKDNQISNTMASYVHKRQMYKNYNAIKRFMLLAYKANQIALQQT